MNLKKFIKDNGPALLTGIGCLGVVGTGYLAYKAGQHKDNKKMLIPPIVVGGVTIVAIIFSHTLSSGIIAGLTAAGTYVAMNKQKLEEEIERQYGTGTLKDIKRKVGKLMAEEYIAPYYGQTIEQSVFGGDLLCFEGFGGRVFRASEETVEDAIKVINERFDNGESLCYNDFYDRLGIRETRFGNAWGWVSNPDYYEWPITFETQLYSNPEEFTNLQDFHEPVLVIDVWTLPMEGWEEI